MSDYFELLEGELRRAAKRSAGPRAAPWRRSGDWIAVAACVVVTLTVVAVVLGLRGHAGSPNRHGAGSARAGSSWFFEHYAVFRRSATAGDRPSAEAAMLLGYGGTPVTVRRAETLPRHARVFVAVDHIRNRSYQIAIAVVGLYLPGGGLVDPRVSGDRYPDALGLRRVSGRSVPVWVALVPDGVASVQWTFHVWHRGRAVDGPTVTVPVIGNIAATSVPGTASNDVVVVGWRDSAGRTIHTYVRAGHAVPPPSPPPVRDVLGPRGVGRARFGALPQEVDTAVRALLHQPGGVYARGGSCGLDHEITWSDQHSANGEPALTAYFRRGRFAGYQYGAIERPRPVRAGTQLATAAGLGVGDTLSRGGRLYGRRFTVSTAQGGSWKVRLAGGAISGYAWGPPSSGALRASGVVATIDAGDVGCPAVSP